MASEMVRMDDYEIQRTRPSVLGLQQEINTIEGFTCPKCQCPNPELGHGHASQCPNCGMHFRRYGNGLICSDKFIEAYSVGRDVLALRSFANQEKTGILQRVREWLAE